MYLKNLTLKGFKSFADPTSMDLKPGVTVVVGPNGSGKSNVVDAIAWVLGVQAPSAVRSAKMDDVIFAGTADRAALGRAEVSITIDNHSRTLPIEFSEVKITRTLFRSGDSQYAINGAPCRLLDVSELLAGGGVGRHRHVVVSQGQIDAVLNARPEDRRDIIEEVAGVSKFRRRTERAERRLLATDRDLVRVTDLMREVRRRLRPLHKQAEAARRHGDLVAELGSLRIHLLGREIERLRHRLSTNAQKRTSSIARLRAADADIDRLSMEISTAERRLCELGCGDLGETLLRLESMRERARGMSVVIAERRKGSERDRLHAASRAVAAAQQAEAATIRAALAEVNDAEVRLEPDLVQLGDLEAAHTADTTMFRAKWDNGVLTADDSLGRSDRARGELNALGISIRSGHDATQRLSARLDELRTRGQELAAAETRYRDDLVSANVAKQQLVEAQTESEQARIVADRALVAARDRQAAEEVDRQLWTARVDALRLALDKVTAQSGLDCLADLNGVLGTLGDLVTIEKGWEAAFAAAVAESFDAVVTESSDVARQVLARLVAASRGGTVLALDTVGVQCSGPPPHTVQVDTELDSSEMSSLRGAAADMSTIRCRVRGSNERVDALLDLLVGHVVAVNGGWIEATSVAIADPSAVVVTSAGDRFSPAGWKVGGGVVGATAAALVEAEDHVVTTTDRVARCMAKTEVLAAEQKLCIRRVEELTDALRVSGAVVDAATDALRGIEAERHVVATDTESLQGQLDELTVRLTSERARVVELETEITTLGVVETQALARSRQLAADRTALAERAADLALRRTETQVRSAELRERRSLLASRLAELEERLGRDAMARAAAERQRIDLDRRMALLNRLADSVDARAQRLDTRIDSVREQKRRQSQDIEAITDRLNVARRRRELLEQDRTALCHEVAQGDVEQAELRTKLEIAVDRLFTEHGLDPDEVVSAPCPELPDEMDAVRRVEMIESELDIIGPVNPLALEEHHQLQERLAFLQDQHNDVRATRRELRKVTASIEQEIVSVFASAFADVSADFSRLFAKLFPGGQGSISLTDPRDLLNTGVEISARPSGKMVRRLSLLSGGERTLVALAFLFAVFRCRPSPFYVMDEVEVALDDVNLHRFLSLVQEFRKQAQLLLISHQQPTMEIADCLYGVSMRSGQSSRIVSEKAPAGVA